MIRVRILGGIRRLVAEVRNATPAASDPGVVTREAPNPAAVVDMNEAAIVGSPVEFRLLVDLSDRVNWPHKGSLYLELVHIRQIIQRSSIGSSYSVKLGVVLAIAAGGATVAYLDPGSVTADTTEPSVRTSEDVDASTQPISLRAAAGALADIVVTETVPEATLTNTTAIKTSLVSQPTAIPSPGDLILRIERTGGAGTVRVHTWVQYRGRS